MIRTSDCRLQHRDYALARILRGSVRSNVLNYLHLNRPTVGVGIFVKGLLLQSEPSPVRTKLPALFTRPDTGAR